MRPWNRDFAHAGLVSRDIVVGGALATLAVANWPKALAASEAVIDAGAAASSIESARKMSKTYKDFPCGMTATHANTINADLLAFLKA